MFFDYASALSGWTIKDRLIGRLPDYAPWAAQLPWLANLRDSLPGAAALSERWLGLAAARRLPRWRRDTFWRMAALRLSSLQLATREEVLVAARPVVLFVDTFNGYFDAENAVDAARVLNAAGYTVHVAAKARPGGSALCCGRTLLAAGMAAAAKTKAAELLAALRPFAERGIAIVGLEPSCLLTLRDEMLVLGLGETAKTVATHSFLLEEFIAREATAGRFNVRFKPATRALRVHGHCHQKAHGAMPAVMDVLRLLPGAAPELIESSCCGMAGSFGFEAKHFAVSMQMAELSLLPAVRAVPEAIIVADGTSCRQQIGDGTGRIALHVARVLAAHLA